MVILARASNGWSTLLMGGLLGTKARYRACQRLGTTRQPALEHGPTEELMKVAEVSEAEADAIPLQVHELATQSSIHE